MSRPNILFLHSDQHRTDCLGVHGHPQLQTPHLDALAAQGVDYSHAFCPIAICTPARASLMTGMWPHAHGALSIWNLCEDRRQLVQTDLPTWSQSLKASGYNLGYVGKWHVHPTWMPTDCGWDEYVPENAYGAWREKQGLAPLAPLDFFGAWDGDTDAAIEPHQSRLAWGADHAIRLLGEYAGRDEPWVVRWDPSEPHLPNRVPPPFASLYNPDELAPWPSFFDALKDKPYIQAQMRRTWGVEGWSWEQWAPIVARYLGEISLLDAQIGRVLRALDESGERDNTLVIYSTDHGDFCGGHGMVDKHCAMYDDILRVPLIMRWPNVLPAGEVCEHFVLGALDLATTVCRAAGVQTPPTFVGRDLIDMATGADAEPRADVYGAYYGCQFGGYSSRMVRDARFKYVWNATAQDELYDLQNDAGELTNLAANPSYAAELTRLRERLLEWMRASEDTLLNGWTERQIGEGLTR